MLKMALQITQVLKSEGYTIGEDRESANGAHEITCSKDGRRFLVAEGTIKEKSVFGAKCPVLCEAVEIVPGEFYLRRWLEGRRLTCDYSYANRPVESTMIEVMASLITLQKHGFRHLYPVPSEMIHRDIIMFHTHGDIVLSCPEKKEQEIAEMFDIAYYAMLGLSVSCRNWRVVSELIRNLAPGYTDKNRIVGNKIMTFEEFFSRHGSEIDRRVELLMKRPFETAPAFTKKSKKPNHQTAAPAGVPLVTRPDSSQMFLLPSQPLSSYKSVQGPPAFQPVPPACQPVQGPPTVRTATAWDSLPPQVAPDVDQEVPPVRETPLVPPTPVAHEELFIQGQAESAPLIHVLPEEPLQTQDSEPAKKETPPGLSPFAKEWQPG